MAETFLPPVETKPEREAPQLHAGTELHWTETKEEGVFASLWTSVRDVFFPVKLPPLVLESKPIAVVDRMAVKQNPKAFAASIAIYALLILLFGYLIKQKVKFSAPVKSVILTDVSVPPPAPPKANAMGGGGGQRGPTPVTKGSPPKFAEVQLVPPKAPPMVDPKIKIEPTIEVQKDVKMASNMPNFGVPNSPIVGMSMGNGSGTGLGSGNGSGLGPGSGGNTGGGRDESAAAYLLRRYCSRWSLSSQKKPARRRLPAMCW